MATFHSTYKAVSRLREIALAVACWMLLCTALSAQSQAVAELDSNLAETGNPFRFHLIIKGQSSKPGQPDFSGWEQVMPRQNILNQTDWEAGNGQWSKDLTLIAFDEDTLILPPLPVQLASGERVLTNPVTIQVIPTPSGSDLIDLRDIKGIHREKTTWQDYLPWIIAAAALLLALLATFWWIARRKRREAVRRNIELPPHELALRKLTALEPRRLWQQGDIKGYYGELSFIVREYLQKRYGIPVLESTSAETIRHLKGTAELPGKLLPEIQELLEQADLAKFAKAAPPDSYHEAAFRFARHLVEQTLEVPAQPEPKTAS
jgi:hypothetical protein